MEPKVTNYDIMGTSQVILLHLKCGKSYTKMFLQNKFESKIEVNFVIRHHITGFMTSDTIILNLNYTLFAGK